MTIFQHGGDIKSFAKLCGCGVEEVVDLSSNINFVKPNIDIDFKTIDISPYPNYDKLYRKVATHYGVAIDEIELYSGGSDAIFALFRDALESGISKCTIYSPAYLEYKRASVLFGYELLIIDRFDSMGSDVLDGSLVIFVNPSTPDGFYYDIESLLEIWSSRDCRVVVDESFIEFTPYSSAMELLDRYPNLYILKSLTKYWGAAGVRIGAIISQPSNIKKLKSKEPLWKISTMDSLYIQSVLDDESFKSRSDSANQKSREYLLHLLQQSRWVKHIYPSVANFILVELEGITADWLQTRLIPYRVMIRSCENFDGLSSSHVRVAIKSIDDMRHLAEVLDA